MFNFRIHFTDGQFRRICNVLDGIQSEITAGFERVAEAIAGLTQPPDTAVEGIFTMRYPFDKDQAPVSYTLVVSGLKSKGGSAARADDIDISAESNSPSLVVALGPQVVADDGLSVSAPITLTGGDMPAADLAVVTYKATNRDTGAVIAADSDEFVTGPPEAVIGAIDSPVPLTEIVPPPA